jgi:gluconolactonase
LAVDGDGRLYVCEHYNRRLTRTEKDGTITVVADKYLGRRLNSPNDLAIRKDGTVFFTDPPYGTEDGVRELPFNGVYSVAPGGGETRLLSVEFRSPNGLAFSPDEKTLYVGDSEDGYVQALTVAEDGMLENGRRIASLKTPDGMKTDTNGNLWVGAADGVHVFSPEGKELKLIAFDKNVSNLAFGGDDGRTLYVTSVDRVFRMKVEW